jgi:N4-gp56 family major capsid protein
MPNSFGFGSDTTGFSSTVHSAIHKQVIETLRAGLVSLPRGAVVPAVATNQQGENFTLVNTSYPDISTSAVTDPLSEGVAPTPIKLGIDTQSFTVQQQGMWTKVTDVASMQSPHDLEAVAQDKVARLAAEYFDLIGQTALAAGATTSALGDVGAAMTSTVLLDALAEAESYNFEPVPGAGFYVICHPYALRGLKGELGLNGYTDVTAQVAAAALTKGAVGQYRGATFLTSTKFTPSGSNYPVYVMGANSLTAGDLGTLSYHKVSGAAPGNELAQYASVGFKVIGGAKVLAFANRADGAGTNDADTTRVLKFTVASGIGSY